jgi:TRAP-type uncharacterized transport system fused permease subunit
MYVQLQAGRMGLRPAPLKKINFKELLLDAPALILPLFFLMFFLIKGYTLMFTAFWAIASSIIIGFINSFRMKTILNKDWWREVGETLLHGLQTAGNIGIIVAVIGLIVTGVEVTGLGVKLGEILENLSGGNLPLLLIFTAMVATILGMGVPTIAAYLLTAVVLSPALISAGVPMFQAHLFPMIFSLFSHLTPPIGIGLIVANQMADGKYWSTAREAVQAAFVAFLVPFLFVYAPGIILDFEHGIGLGIAEMLAAIFIVASVQVMLQRRYMTDLNLMEMLLHPIIIIFSLAFLFLWKQNIVFMIIVILFVLLSLISFWRYRVQRASNFSEEAPAE